MNSVYLSLVSCNSVLTCTGCPTALTGNDVQLYKRIKYLSNRQEILYRSKCFHDIVISALTTIKGIYVIDKVLCMLFNGYRGKAAKA
jgi:hypothetical protein